jgi:DNA-binding PadR family transcriptional regulator
LRLYLLKLLDEAPRHGYDVIRLLQDRFLGVYSPSPGTIYPRLARLEEEGLVTHEMVDGKKIYRITDAGRAELNRRLDDLADLEDELSASVRDIAKEISRDVRETVRNLRDELTWAVREAGRAGREAGAGAGAGAGSGQDEDATASSARPSAPDEAAQPAGAAADAGPGPNGGAWGAATAEAGAAHATEPPAAEQAAGEPGAGEFTGEPRPEAGDSESGQERRGRGDWRDWSDWAERHDWRDWVDWAKRQGWGEWTGMQDWKDRAKAGRADWSQTGRPDWIKGGGPRDRRDAGPDLMSDLEHLAAAFAREIRGVARQAENVSDDAIGNLGRILFDTLNKIRAEVFRPANTDKNPEHDQDPPNGPPPA